MPQNSIGATPGNPTTKTTETEFRHLKIKENGYSVDYRYNPIEFIGDSCIF